MLRAEDVTVRVEDLGLALEGKNQRPPNWDHAQRLVRGIQDERSAQSASKYMGEMPVSRWS